MNNPIKEIAITGGIGSGKSYISAVFEKLGIPVYYSDNRAKDLVNTKREIKDKIISLLGKKAYHKGTYDSKFVASQVFKDKRLLEKLNSIIHPIVAKDYKSWVASNNSSPYLLKESALIFELNIEGDFYKTILAKAEKQHRIERLLKRDTWRTKKEIEAIFSKQLTDRIKEDKSDFVINTKPTELIVPQIIKIHESLIK